MKMKRCIIATILLMLSLEAALLVAGRPSAAAVADDLGTIRLPSDGQDQVVMAGRRPWKCCDRTICTRSIPPICWCLDEVEQCAATCKLCEQSMSDPPRYVCGDRYRGDPGPKCTKDVVDGNGNNDDDAAKAKHASHDYQVVTAATRPWKCCDVTVCTKSLPPICRCMDEVDKSAATCKACKPSMLNPPRRVCQDQYIGDPGPKCTEDGDLNDGIVKAKGASHDHQVTVAAAKKNGEEEERPWKCCDMGVCTLSYPPTCRCMDEVEQCAATCKSCEPSMSDPSRHVCNDWYHGFPGPKCTEAVAAGGN